MCFLLAVALRHPNLCLTRQIAMSEVMPLCSEENCRGVGQRTCSVSLSAAGPPVAGPVWSTTQAACQAAGRGCPSDRAEGNTTCPRSGGVYEHVVSTNIEPHPHLTYRCVCMYAHVRVRECVLCVERVNLSLGG